MAWTGLGQWRLSDTFVIMLKLGQQDLTKG